MNLCGPINIRKSHETRKKNANVMDKTSSKRSDPCPGFQKGQTSQSETRYTLSWPQNLH